MGRYKEYGGLRYRLLCAPVSAGGHMCKVPPLPPRSPIRVVILCGGIPEARRYSCASSHSCALDMVDTIPKLSYALSLPAWIDSIVCVPLQATREHALRFATTSTFRMLNRVLLRTRSSYSKQFRSLSTNSAL